MISNASRRRAAILSSAVLALTACGGGDSGSAPAPAAPTPAPAPATISGIVLTPITAAGAPAAAPSTVCYDANKNGSCDTGEPATTTTATATSGEGAFTLTGLPTTQPADVAIVAQVPAGTIPAYTLRAPAAKPTLISAVTTLVQAGVAQGMSLATAEAGVARQLQVDATSLYANYRSLPNGPEKTWIGALATFIVQNLQQGIPLRVGPPMSPVAGYEVVAFNMGSLANHNLSYAYSTHIADATTGLIPYYSLNQTLTNGTPQPPPVLPGSWTLSPQGWKPNHGLAYTHHMTAGNPYVSLSANGTRTAVATQEIDVSGETIGSVVTRVTSLGSTTNTFNTLILPAAAGANSLPGSMPPGAKIRVLRSATLATPAMYRESDRLDVAATTLTGLIAAYPPLTSGANAGNANSVLLSRIATHDVLGGTRGCSPTFSYDSAGNQMCANSDVRATFDASGTTATVYLCDYSFDVTPGSTNCISVGTATTTPATMDDGTTPSLTFTNLPAAVLGQVSLRTLIQRNGALYKATPASRSTVFTYTINSRMNRIAFGALAAALNVPAPSNPTFTSPSPYLGLWQATYAGPGNGTCASILVDAAGNLIGNCQPSFGSAFTVAGTVSTTGSLIPSAATGSTGFSGQFSPTSAAGTWHDTSTSTNGTWSATKYQW